MTQYIIVRTFSQVSDVGQHRLQRGQVAVDVGKGSNAHGTFP